jgi:hypothetical protein
VTQYSINQVAQFAYNAGFRGQALADAVSVAMAESSGVSTAVSSDGYGSHGLWQFIPSTWARITGTPFTNADDPQKNANAAFKLYQANGNSFAGQWSTWTNGSITAADKTAAANAAAAVDTSGQATTTSASGTTNAVETGLDLNPLDGFGIPKTIAGAATSGLASLFKPLIEFAIEAGLIIGGFWLIVLGGFFVVREVK